MTMIFGNFGLGLGVFVAAAALMAAISAARFRSEVFLRAARVLVGMFAALMTISAIALLAALVGSDFRYEYVASYTERALPLGYKLAAFWAGQAGSLLLWAWLLGAMSVVFILSTRRTSGTEPALAIATLSTVLMFFAALILFAANPFATQPVVPLDGHGLNPMLQDPGMIAHPPLLFLGYAGFTIPFAALVGALAAGRRDNQWLAGARRWIVASWLFLSIGILLGAQWAYVELGWGGYWAWDPVENASLLPWLTGTALLHSVIAQQQRGVLKRWNAVLIAVTFFLCIFGTYLTRSGVIQSVHSFGESAIGTFFLSFLLIGSLLAAGLIALRWAALRPEHSLEVLLGREGFFLATNVLLTAMTLVTLIGTVFPILSRTFHSREVTVGPSFYNTVVAPLGLLLAGLMSVGPLLGYGRESSAKFIRRLAIPLAGGLAAGAALVLLGVHSAWAVLCGFIAGVTALAILADLVRSVAYRARSTGENVVAALAGLLDANHRRYGGQVVHAGIMMIVIGVTGSSLFIQKQSVSMTPGSEQTFAGRTIRFEGLREVRKGNFTAVEAPLVITDASGRTSTVLPQRRFYDKSEQSNSEVAIQSSWRQDLYITLQGWEAGGSITTLEFVLNPLVGWIWIGGMVLTVGGAICLLPRLIRRPAEVAVAMQEEPTAARASAVANKNGRGHANRAAARPSGRAEASVENAVQ